MEQSATIFISEYKIVEKWMEITSMHFVKRT